VAPREETAVLCEAVHVDAAALALVARAIRLLWCLRSALSVAPWTGDGAPRLLRLAPFLLPPFRALFLNAQHDFLPGTPFKIALHNWRNFRDAVHSDMGRLADIAAGCWQLIAYHVWRSGPWVRTKDILRGWGLWMTATLLRCLGYPHRRWFPRLHGRDGLTAAPLSAGRDGIARFIQIGREWHAREFEDFVRASDARWILWCEENVPEDAAGMPPLFADQRTFAVGRQVDYRGWKRQLATAAPFRTLQPGEATRVLAPLSRALLVDRNKLLALGIPQCSLPGAAWMILFWKAAAAGWCSYSMGQQKPLRPQPDCPLEETSFFLHVIRDGSLRRIGPAKAELSAGNIAFAADRARPYPGSAGRLRVLVVSPFLPFPFSHGGAVRIYNLCRSLRDRVDFALIAIREKDEQVDYSRLHEVFREVRIVDLDARASSDRRLPRQVRSHQSASLRALIAEMAQAWQPDLLQIEYTHMAAFGDCAPSVPNLLVEHDLTFSLYRQIATNRRTLDARREYERWRNFECEALRRFHGVWTVCEEDRLAAIRESGRPAGRTFTVPNGVDTNRFMPHDAPDGGAGILFVGSFRHLPNRIAFEALCQQVMPRVWVRHPEAHLHVVAGPRHEDFWKGSTDPRVTVEGFVEDLRPLYANATAVAVPLEVSAGTNIKVLEAMACGKAIVSTAPGCTGLGICDGAELLIREDWSGFAEALSDVIADAVLRRRLGEQARRAAENGFSWTAIADHAWLSYLRLVRRTRAGRSRLRRAEAGAA
jgi:glycosyltransferase involved in cell wall biosynthesis